MIIDPGTYRAIPKNGLFNEKFFVYGNLVRHEKSDYTAIITQDTGDIYDVERKTFCQCTGKTDIDGVPIFVHDVIEWFSLGLYAVTLKKNIYWLTPIYGGPGYAMETDVSYRVRGNLLLSKEFKKFMPKVIKLEKEWRDLYGYN